MLSTPPNDRGPKDLKPRPDAQPLPVGQKTDDGETPLPIGYGEPDNDCRSCGRRTFPGHDYCRQCGGPRPYFSRRQNPDSTEF